MKYTVNEAAQLLGVSKTAIRNHMKALDPAEILREEVRGQQWTYLTESAVEAIRAALECNTVPTMEDRRTENNREEEPETTAKDNREEPQTAGTTTDNSREEPEEKPQSTEQNRTEPESPAGEVEWLRKQVDRLTDQLEKQSAEMAAIRESYEADKRALYNALGTAQATIEGLRMQIPAQASRPVEVTVEATEAAAGPTDHGADPEARGLWQRIFGKKKKRGEG